MTITLTPKVIIDGVEAYARKADLLQGLPTVLDGLQFTWGRNTIVDQPDASTATFDVRQRNGFPLTPSLFEYIHAGASVQVYAVNDATGEQRLVWAGEVANADIGETDPYAIQASVTCIDPSAALSNVKVGTEPWPEESAYDRFLHILAAAGLRISDLRPGSAGWSWALTGDMDDTIHAPMVAFRDIDAQPPLDLIKALADSVGGVAWVTADDAGPYVWIEDPTQRKGLRQFVIDPDTNQVSIGTLSLDFGVNRWTKKDIVPSTVKWTQDPAQSINLVDVDWQQRTGTNDQGNPDYNQVTVEIADSDSNKGIRALDRSTELIDDADARMLAAHWLAQAQTADWIVSGLSIDTDILNRPSTVVDSDTRMASVMDLLDCRTRIGYRVTITELPTYAPTGAEQSYYIEGGTYTWAASRWQMDLVASANAIGGGAHFNQFPPGVKISDFAGLKGRDVWGAAPPNLSAPVVPFTVPVMI